MDINNSRMHFAITAIARMADNVEEIPEILSRLGEVPTSEWERIIKNVTTPLDKSQGLLRTSRGSVVPERKY